MGAAFHCCATTIERDEMMTRQPTTAEACTTTDLAIRPADADSRVAVLRYELPALQQLVQDTFGDSSAPLDFDRIAMPTKGTVTFALPTPAGEQHPATMLGVVLAAQSKRAFWAEEFTGGGVPPDCTSRDGVLGVGTPGGICRECPCSQFDDDGTPPACTETMDLTFVGLDDELPTILTVHKMSVKTVQQYKRSLRKYRMDLSAVITELGLQEGRYRNGKSFTKLTLRAVGVLSPAEQGRMRAARTAFGLGRGRRTLAARRHCPCRARRRLPIAFRVRMTSSTSSQSTPPSIPPPMRTPLRAPWTRIAEPRDDEAPGARQAPGARKDDHGHSRRSDRARQRGTDVCDAAPLARAASARDAR